MKRHYAGIGAAVVATLALSSGAFAGQAPAAPAAPAGGCATRHTTTSATS